jgi:hypothetical protein
MGGQRCKEREDEGRKDTIKLTHNAVRHSTVHRLVPSMRLGVCVVGGGYIGWGGRSRVRLHFGWY